MNNIVGQGVWYDIFQVKNTKWLGLVNDIVTTSEIDELLCGSIGVYSSYAAGILNCVEEIHFYLLADYVEKFTARKDCNVTYKTHTGDIFGLSSSSETIALSFKARQFPKLTSELMFGKV